MGLFFCPESLNGVALRFSGGGQFYLEAEF
jgi:hypothetical protein